MHQPKAISCDGIPTSSNIALSFTYQFTVIWNFPSQLVGVKLPTSSWQVIVDGTGDNGSYQGISGTNTITENKQSNANASKSGNMTTETETHTVKLTLGATCKTETLKLPYIEGLTKPGASATTTKIISPASGKFTLKLSMNGQELTKDFTVVEGK